MKDMFGNNLTEADSFGNPRDAEYQRDRRKQVVGSDNDSISEAGAMKDTDRIGQILDECIECAREQGYEGKDNDYVFTEPDLEAVIEELGYKPTREQWYAAGCYDIGGSHVGDGTQSNGLTVQEAKDCEAMQLIEALGYCIELDDAFLRDCCGEEVQKVLGSIPEKDRAYVLDDAIDEEEAAFRGGYCSLGDSEIFLRVHEIEVQLDEDPEDYLAEPYEWYIDGGSDLAYLNVGQGLFIPVDIEAVKENIDSSTCHE